MNDMETCIPTKSEFQKAIAEAVEKAVCERIPEIVKKATAKDVYTQDEVCKLLDVTRRHLLYLRNSGQINYIQNGRKIYFRAADLQEFFDKNYIDQK